MPEFPRTPRQVADRFVEDLVDLNPITGTSLGLRPHDDRMPDYSPAGHEERDSLMRRALKDLDDAEAGLEAATGADLDLVAERRCGKLLRERLTASLATADAGEHLRELSNLFCPLHTVRNVFTMMPTVTDEDWAVIARRMARVPEAYASYRASLEDGAARGLLAGPAQVRTVLEQLTDWLDGSWFGEFVDAGPERLRPELGDAALAATRAVEEIRSYLRDQYGPRAERTPDTVGRDRYAMWARVWTGADLDLDEAYHWGWAEYARIDVQMRAEAERVLPGATPREAMTHLDANGPAVEGVEPIRQRLQQMMDEAIAALDGEHFDLAPEVKQVEAMIAPAGSAAAPYYTRPSMDFSRPGRTWLPTLGRNRFPLWDLVSTWYHEGVPGHHLQLAQWVLVAPTLSLYQTTLGQVSATTEGWALYAERLMDELGFLTDPGHRLGYLDAQSMRAIRVIIDIGMHLRLQIPHDQGVPDAFHPGRTWTPELGREFFGRTSGRDPAFLDSEIVRYLGIPGQAISYKLGERAWLAGRDAARAARGGDFELKSWHMAAVSMGSLGLDDLTDELARL